MAELDRISLIGLLDRLGAENDDEALAAARALHREVREAGLGWDDLLLPEGGADAPPPAPAAAQAEDAPARAAAREGTDEGALVDRLLARADITDTTRETLADIKADIDRGELDPLDRNYLRALADRLGA